MKKVRNSEVVTSWTEGNPAQNHRASFSTDGKSLYSYQLKIGDTCEVTDKKILRDHTANGRWDYRSQTTSCHVGLARHKADLID